MAVQIDHDDTARQAAGAGLGLGLATGDSRRADRLGRRASPSGEKMEWDRPHAGPSVPGGDLPAPALVRPR